VAVASSSPASRPAVPSPVNVRGASVQAAPREPREAVVRFSTEGAPGQLASEGHSPHVDATAANFSTAGFSEESSQLFEEGGSPVGNPTYMSFHISKAH